MFRRVFLPTLILAVALGAFALGTGQRAAAAPRDIRDFTLYNDSSSVTILNVYVSPSSSNYWGDDILGDQVIVPGDYADITFSPFAGFDTCVYDIRIDGDDGSTTYDWGVDLCSTTAVHYS
ncbi:MAG TPA: hypothetical protein VFA70_01875 [Dehalococcoidia bacterium]|jgi:hypothetical protein|nr:hypothetical protein [Dehalococcoidia bacterium]